MEKIEIFAGSTLRNAKEWLEEMAGKIVIKQRTFDPSSQQLIIFYEPVPISMIVTWENTSDATINQWLVSKRGVAIESKGIFRVIQTQVSVSMAESTIKTATKTVTQIHYEEL